MEETFTAYVTKYALTKKGIIEITAVRCNCSVDGMIEEIGNTNKVYLKKDWSATFQEAIQIAETMRRKKIAILKLQLNKLENLTFTGDN